MLGQGMAGMVKVFPMICCIVTRGTERPFGLPALVFAGFKSTGRICIHFTSFLRHLQSTSVDDTRNRCPTERQ